MELVQTKQKALSAPYSQVTAGLWILLGIYLACMLLLFRPSLQSVDAKGYYAWVRSVVIDGDLNMRNDFTERVCGAKVEGCMYQANPYGIGTSLLLSPFFLLGHLLAPLLGAARDGYSAPYIFLYGIGSSLYGLAGIWLAWQAARLLYSAEASLLSVVTIWLASPLLFYMFPNNLYSHAVDVFVNALFLYVYLRTRGVSPRPHRLWFLYGVLIGVAMLIRPPNVFLVLFPLVESGARLWRRERAPLQELAHYALLGLGVILLLTPQMVVWKITRGAWIITNPYIGIYPDTADFAHPAILKTLFSADRGFLLWSPAFLLALLSLPLVARRDRVLAGGMTLFFLLHFYLNASWTAPPSPFGFGPRLFLVVVPVAVLGMAALLDQVRKRLHLRTLWAVATVFILWNVLLMGQYALQLVPSFGDVDGRALIRNQFTLVPNHIDRLLRAVGGERR